MLYDSLHQKLATLPDTTLVYPAHGAGSMCGKNLSSDTVSTIGEQRRSNYALQPMSRDDFKAIVTAEQPEAPGYFVHDATLNRLEHPSLDTALKNSLTALDLTRVLELRDQAAQIVDTRDPIDFEGAHLAGAMNIGINGKYATWCGTLLNGHDPIVVIAYPGREEEAVIRLGRIGFDNVAGYLKNGMDAVADRPELIRHVERITAMALFESLADHAAGTIVDVRTPKEWAAGHVRGTLNIPLNHLRERMNELPQGNIVVHCEAGYRSAMAAGILQRAGRENVLDLVGGYKAWTASNLPVEP
jgi:rhodanese-related sulfurtransferase